MSSPYNIDSSSTDNPYGIDQGITFSPLENVMLMVHPWMLGIAAAIITIGGLYGGIVNPFLGRILRIKWFNSGYAHDSPVFTIIFSAFVGLLVPVAAFLVWFLRGRQMGQDPVTAVWYNLSYWSNTDGQFIMPVFLFWYIYGSLLFMLVLNSIFALCARWDAPLTEVKQVSEKHAFVIVAHNSTWKLAAPIQCILKFAQPHQIYIADNGSTEEEQASMRQMCADLSTPDSKINISHLKYGNKTLAQYACVKELIRRFNNDQSAAEYITLIDDDVFIPETFSGESIEKKFEDPSIIAIAYPLRIANTDASFIAALQDPEYLTGNVARYIQDILGTQLFCSGAIATWKLTQLQHVLERHCTAFNGEDLEMGYLLHKLCSKDTSKLEVEGAVRIGFEPNCVVSTTGPVHLWHWYDFIPAPLKRRWGIRNCKCRETSFWSQRMRSWDPCVWQFVPKFLKIVFSPRGTTYTPKLFIRVLCTWKLISILRELLLIVGIIISFVRLRNVIELRNLAIFYLDCVIIAWGIGILVTAVQSLSVSRQKLAIRPDVITAYPVCLELVYGLIIRVASFYYSALYYLYAHRFPKDLRTQLQEDPEKAEAIESVWNRSQ